jgi:hypothetical protein
VRRRRPVRGTVRLVEGTSRPVRETVNKGVLVVREVAQLVSWPVRGPVTEVAPG